MCCDLGFLFDLWCWGLNPRPYMWTRQAFSHWVIPFPFIGSSVEKWLGCCFVYEVKELDWFAWGYIFNLTDLGYEPKFAWLPQTTVTTAFFNLATVVLELRQISLIFSVKTEKLKVECRGSVIMFLRAGMLVGKVSVSFKCLLPSCLCVGTQRGAWGLGMLLFYRLQLLMVGL